MKARVRHPFRRPHLRPLDLVLCTALFGATPALAEEGMWTFDAFPKEAVKSAYKTAPDDAWLERVRLSSVRLAQGCSGSFVSSDGLILTNHHCVLRCVQQLSSEDSDLVTQGFAAPKRDKERRCPAFEVNQLVEITDVTERVQSSLTGKTGKAFQDARKAVTATIEGDCAKSEDNRCDVVSLYRGGLYHLYKYRRYQDVRLAFAPEFASAFFGGDPDNFNFPRYNLDFAFLRVYVDDRPLQVKNWLPWSPAGPKENELVFISGHPGSTNRLLTVAQLEYLRDFQHPETLMTLAELRGRLVRMSTEDEEAARIAKGLKFGVENGFKAYRGRREALVDPVFFDEQRRAETQLREAVQKDPELQKLVKTAWEDIAKATERKRDMRFAVRHIMAPSAYYSKLFGHARTLVRWAEEKEKPNPKRLPEFAEARLPELKAMLLSKAPIYPRLEAEVLAFAFEQVRRELGPDHPFVGTLLANESPRGLAERLVETSKLFDAEERKRLFEGGPSALSESKDPFIVLARRADPEARQARSTYENEVESVIDQASERIARARFEILGTDVYPDATFSLRLSYGKVTGFPHLGEPVKAFTNFAGLYARATGEPPFRLPERFVQKKDKLNLEQPLNFVSTNDIIGGNSGSPVIDAQGQLVGLVFDGNIYSLGGDYGFDERVNRAVSVHSGAMLEALDKGWGLQPLVKELRGS